jgi:hypothetical protein
VNPREDWFPRIVINFLEPSMIPPSMHVSPFGDGAEWPCNHVGPYFPSVVVSACWFPVAESNGAHVPGEEGKKAQA